MNKKNIGLRAALIVLLFFVALSGVSVQARERVSSTGAFSDVPQGLWYTEAVEVLTRANVIGKAEDGLFRPQDNISRAEFLRMLCGIRGERITFTKESTGFSDVKPIHWYAPYVVWALRQKILLRDSETFRPHDAITRQEAAAMLSRFSKNTMGRKLPVKRSTDFADADQISGLVWDEVQAVADATLLNNYPDGTFQPSRFITRAQAADILYRYYTSYRQYQEVPRLDGSRYIIHAGGAYGEMTVTNSLEALNATYDNGDRVVEIDFAWTTDGELVCSHGWGGPLIEQCSLEEFKNHKIKGSLTPMALHDLAVWMRAHPDMILVPDIPLDSADGLRIIWERYPDLLPQIYPYVYHLEDYEEIMEMGYQNPILIFYQMRNAEKSDPESMISFARENGMMGVAVSGEELNIGAEAQKYGLPIWIWTVDSEEEMRRYAASGYNAYVTNYQDLKPY